jgi:hypothetical protein
MSAGEIEIGVKRLGLMALVLIFFSTSARALEGCESSGGNPERVVARMAIAEAVTRTSGSPSIVSDNPRELERGEVTVGSLLALHCEATSDLLLGRAVPGSLHPACDMGHPSSTVR